MKHQLHLGYEEMCVKLLLIISRLFAALDHSHHRRDSTMIVNGVSRFWCY